MLPALRVLTRLGRRPRHGLALRLVLLHLLLVLPALAVADWYVLQEEARRLQQGLAAGSLDRAGAQIAARLEAQSAQHAHSPEVLWLLLERERLLLEQTGSGLAEGSGHILRELSATPLGIGLRDTEGQWLVVSGVTPDSGAGDADESSAREQPAGLRWQARQELQLGERRLELVLQLAVPHPGISLLGMRSFEAGILVVTSILLALLGGMVLSSYVARRLGRINALVEAWREGELQRRIGGSRHDEIGQLALALDGMAANLEQLLQDRARLGALEERQRVARDLHDTVKQKAFALGLQLATLRRCLRVPEPALVEAERLAAEIRGELADVVSALQSEERPPQPFRERLDARARRWQLSCQLQLQLLLAPGPEPSASAAEQLLRIVDEGLANVSRHAGPCRVSLRLGPAGDGHWLLKIEDSGRGFETGTGGNGLANLAARAAALRGRIRIDSRPGGGTRIEVLFPLGEGDASSGATRLGAAQPRALGG